MSKIKQQLIADIEESSEPTEQRFIITIGIPASGKSKWANQYQSERQKYYGERWLISERDTLRSIHFCDDYDLNTYKFSKTKEQQITQLQYDGIQSDLDLGYNIIVADTNLNDKTRFKLERLALMNGIEPEYKVFDTPLHVCIKRNLKRNHTVPESVLINMETRLREYLEKPVYKPQAGLQHCIIVDVDGTLADMQGIRGPFEWDKVHLDNPRENIIRLVQKWINGYKGKVFIFTGRDGSALDLTKMWLKNHNVTYDDIFIRPEGNNLNDTIIKEQMFADNIHGKYNVDFVIDDRAQVCKMWCSLGLDVIDVGNSVSDF